MYCNSTWQKSFLKEKQVITSKVMRAILESIHIVTNAKDSSASLHGVIIDHLGK